MKSLGRHLLVELYGVDSSLLNDNEEVEKILVEAAARAKVRVVDVIFHKFNPYGVSGVVVIAESHFAIHTWPEYGYASIDLYTCGDKVNPWKAYEYLLKRFGAKFSNAMEMKRGVIHATGKRLRHKPRGAK